MPSALIRPNRPSPDPLQDRSGHPNQNLDCHLTDPSLAGVCVRMRRVAGRGECGRKARGLAGKHQVVQGGEDDGRLALAGRCGLDDLERLG